jgi:hypothetical protein
MDRHLLLPAHRSRWERVTRVPDAGLSYQPESLQRSVCIDNDAVEAPEERSHAVELSDTRIELQVMAKQGKTERSQLRLFQNGCYTDGALGEHDGELII